MVSEVQEVDLDQSPAVLQALEHEGARYVVIGAVALNLHGLARMTRDLDLFIEASPDNVESVKRALRSIFDDRAIEEISAADLQGEYPAVAYVPPAGDFSIDLLARLGQAFRFEEIEFQVLEHGGLHVRVATPRMPYRMKMDTIRLQDRADAERLRERFGLEEE